MKKKLMCTLVIVGLMGCLFVLNSFAVTNTNAGSSDNKIRVIVGQDDLEMGDLTNAKSIVLADSLAVLTQTDTVSEVPALVSFNDFLTVDETTELLDSITNIKTVYIWMPNATGRCIIDVVDNDLSGTITSYFNTLDIEEIPDSNFKNDMRQLVSSYGVFAVELSGSYDELNNLMDNEAVARVDLIKSEEAVALANKTNSSVSYICIPQSQMGQSECL